MRIRPANRVGRDRRLRLSDLIVTLFVLVVGCVRAPEPVRRDEVHRPEVWVDAFSPAGGDGTRTHPLKALPQPVPAGALVHLLAGIYAGPFRLGDGARLEGLGEVVLTAERGQTVVTAAEASLDGVALQGGDVGLESGPGVVVTRAHFSGQRRKAVLVHGALAMSDSRLEASVEGIDGVVVERGARLSLENTQFTGGFRRAVMTEGGTVDLQLVSAEGAKTLLHAIDATSRLRELRSGLGSGPALFFAGGTVELREAELRGHEYAVQLARGVEATLSGVHASGSLEGCVSAIASRVTISNSTLAECGPGGALSVFDSHTTVSNLEITNSRELGILVRQGQAALRNVHISKVSGSGESLGDGLHVRDGRVVVESLSVSDVEGSAVFASAFAELSVRRLEVERARHSALFVERGARVTVGAMLVSGGGTAVVVPDAASVDLDSLSVAGGNEMPIYAECSAGAKVTLGRLESTVQQLPSHCVQISK